MNRGECLDTAKQIVTTDRNEQYGEPEDNFKVIATLWNDYIKQIPIGMDLTSEDVANMMILFKVARNLANPKDDNWVDICGYAACGCEVAAH